MTHRPGIRLCSTGTLCLVLVACAASAPVPQPPEVSVQHLTSQIASLEQRRLRLEDINAIKRLQAAYGYYLDQGLWDEATALFTDDASIEWGLDGVYRGKARVRQYLYALGGGKAGLAPGQLNEHLQLMPVITLAADGQSAKGTWRDLILSGQLGQNAYWGEGPYENEYAKVNGVWKIRRIHWFQTLFVPYEGGWAKHDDVNGGKWVSDKLKPDAPPTIEYRPWPGAFTPPFHFRPGVQGTAGTSASASGAGGSAATASLPATPASESASRKSTAPSGESHDAQPNADANLVTRAARLLGDVQRLEAQDAIENLQQMYGYYIDKGMWVQASNLFAADGTLEVEGRGAWVGRPHVLDYLRAIGPEGPTEGRLFDNMQLQPVVHVAPDGKTAKARWLLFAQLAEHHHFAEWGLGVYENDYVRENGVWRIAKLHLYPTLYTPYESGWGKQWLAYSHFEPALKPDRASPGRGSDAEHRPRAPFHYPNPSTVSAHARPSGPPAAHLEPSGLESALHDIDHRLARLEDVTQIENLQSTYGYYLATLLWDDLTNLFARDGTIEIALRGVYVGKASVRRNLNLYGQQGLDQGVLHNHMQFQPVINVADDGLTARMRSRAFSMMGNAGKVGMWMGGVYENQLVKEDGVWKIEKDQVMNTYFTPYEVGWKELAPRPAPGITASNPPDRPPTVYFEMYPKAFLPPYHYPDPVAEPQASR